MGPSKQPDSGLFLRQKSFLPLSAVLIESAPRAISDANEDKWDAPGQRFCNRTPINGLGPFLVQETAITEQNCDKPSKPSRLMRRHVRFPSLRSSYASMDCME